MTTRQDKEKAIEGQRDFVKYQNASRATNHFNAGGIEWTEIIVKDKDGEAFRFERKDMKTFFIHKNYKKGETFEVEPKTTIVIYNDEHDIRVPNVSPMK